MEYLVTKKEMQAYDTYTIEQIGVPALVLMERAALCVTERVYSVLKDMGRIMPKAEPKAEPKTKAAICPKVLCVCGVGNNGGDGLAVARMLMDEGIAVDVALIGDKAYASNETKVQLDILEKYRVSPFDKVPKANYDVVVDALFGTGLSREVSGVYKEAIEALNATENIYAAESYRIAIDMPSGIDADTGAVLGAAVKAHETVTIAFKKRGLYLYPGANHAGKIHVTKIGITEKSFAVGAPKMYTLTGEPSVLLPKRRADGNKGTFGKVLLVAGSSTMAGAALLSASSAYKTGAGMVKVVIPEKIRVIVQEKLPEALIQVYDSENGLTASETKLFLENADWADIIAVGPGLSKHTSGKQLLELAICRTKKNLVLDADALNMLAEDEKLQEKLLTRNRKSIEKAVTEKKTTENGGLETTDTAYSILTPHLGELARLLRKETKAVVDHQIDCCKEAVEKFGGIVVAKSARTCVCGADEPDFLNTAGNDKMATAGSGDVLTGIIAALLAQGASQGQMYGDGRTFSPKEAAVLGVYLHAKAGNKAAKKAASAGKTADADTTPCIGILASDIVENI